ncbi:WbqC family protein [Bacillus sp. T33-2]|uniref:WbqC family protein n=1 Tax=Bacillus sp. T33-2 TaxID=2054168 RepID=UPI000C783185|nr:WbqC family protein [Bacillus sp. T33-2]PLR90843.1 hypothetical protein CVD19_22245 [Bacillus sp. T33-2]
MRIALMQPYLFPYIGYFQLIQAVDKFVIYDDVQYIKGGWINRNKILVNNQEFLFTFSIEQGKMQSKINERMLSSKYRYEKEKFVKTIVQNYRKAPFFQDTIKLIDKILSSEQINLSNLIYKSILCLNEYLDIPTEVILSSSINKNGLGSAQDSVIEIVNLLRGNTYINAIGGVQLYSKHTFKMKDIDLLFLKPTEISYPQFGYPFISNLSIIDVLMFNSRDNIKDLLNRYELI